MLTDYGESNMMNCNYSPWKVFLCISYAFPILHFTISSSSLREESLRIAFVQESLFFVFIWVVWCSLAPFLNNNWTAYHIPKCTDNHCFSWSFLYMPAHSKLSTWITISKYSQIIYLIGATRENYMPKLVHKGKPMWVLLCLTDPWLCAFWNYYA